MMKMVAIYILIVVAAIGALLFTKVRRLGIASLWNCLKRALKCLLSFTFGLAALAFCMLFCYADVAQLLKETLATESVQNIRNLIRLFTGIDSAFAAVQAVAFGSLMMSVVSCVALIFGEGIAYALFFEAEKGEKTVLCSDMGEVIFPELACEKSYLVYSKYNS